MYIGRRPFGRTLGGHQERGKSLNILKNGSHSMTTTPY